MKYEGVHHPSFFVSTLTPTTQDLILPTLPPCEDMRMLRPLLLVRVTLNIHPTNSDDPERVLWIS
jgi:hypothetical protein